MSLSAEHVILSEAFPHVSGQSSIPCATRQPRAPFMPRHAWRIDLHEAPGRISKVATEMIAAGQVFPFHTVMKKQESITGGKDRFQNSNLAQYKRVVNTIIDEGGISPHLLLDGFLHTENCASLWIFSPTARGGELDISTAYGEEPCLSFRDAGVEIYLFEKMERGKLLELNSRLGRNPDTCPEELETQWKPFVHSIFERRVITSKIIPAGMRSVKSTRDPDIIPGDHKGMTEMLSSLQPALEARARGALARIVEVSATSWSWSR
jgi:hypothetical protein